MISIKIRVATMEDCPAIANVYRDEPGWWADLSVCEPLMVHRLGRGFYNHVAYADEKIVGHGEWIIDDGFDGKFLYLGMLQIDPDFQRRGIGGQMLTEGERYAKSYGCSEIRLMTSTDEDGAAGFYEKYGYSISNRIVSAVIPTTGFSHLSEQYSAVDAIPFRAIEELRFTLGVSQTSSRHMWEVINTPHSIDKRRVETITDGTAFICQTWFPDAKSGMSLCWGDVDGKRIADILGFAGSLGLEAANMTLFENNISLLDGYDATVEPEGVEMRKVL